MARLWRCCAQPAESWCARHVDLPPLWSCGPRLSDNARAGHLSSTFCRTYRAWNSGRFRTWADAKEAASQADETREQYRREDAEASRRPKSPELPPRRRSPQREPSRRRNADKGDERRARSRARLRSRSRSDSRTRQARARRKAQEVKTYSRGRRGQELTESEESDSADQASPAVKRDNRVRAHTTKHENKREQRPERVASAPAARKEAQSQRTSVKTQQAKAPTKQGATPLRASKTTEEFEDITVEEDDSASYSYYYTDSEAKEKEPRLPSPRLRRHPRRPRRATRSPRRHPAEPLLWTLTTRWLCSTRCWLRR